MLLFTPMGQEVRGQMFQSYGYDRRCNRALETSLSHKIKLQECYRGTVNGSKRRK